eukprot:3208967-Pyramimonas_sp.AAC.1
MNIRDFVLHCSVLPLGCVPFAAYRARPRHNACSAVLDERSLSFVAQAWHLTVQDSLTSTSLDSAVICLGACVNETACDFNERVQRSHIDVAY